MNEAFGTDWFSVCLGILIVLIFAAIFTLLRTMSSPYIKRFEFLVQKQLEEIEGLDESYRLKFDFEGRAFEVLELKHETKEDFKKVYNSFVLLKAKTKTAFTLRIDDVLSKINVAGILEDALREKLDNSASPVDGKDFGEIFKDFRISTNDRDKAEKLLSDPEIRAVLAAFKTQFSAYGFLMPILISKGEIVIDYSLSERLLGELVFNPRNLLEHARLLNIIARGVEAGA
jgi:hypothetical protein